MAGLTKKQILTLFDQLNDELSLEKVVGELYLVGGAVMCIAFNERPATKDVDALFVPKKRIREIAQRLAADSDLPLDWLNDAVKGFLSESGDFDSFLELTHLKVFTARPEYLLAMKCLAMRLGPEFHDEADVRYLLRYLNIETYEQAIQTITLYYPFDRFPQKTLYALEEILAGG